MIDKESNIQHWIYNKIVKNDYKLLTSIVPAIKARLQIIVKLFNRREA